MVSTFLCGLVTGLLLPAAWYVYRRVRASQGVDGYMPPEPAPRGVLRNPPPPTAPSADDPVITRMSLRNVPGRRVRRTGR